MYPVQYIIGPKASRGNSGPLKKKEKDYEGALKEFRLHWMRSDISHYYYYCIIVLYYGIVLLYCIIILAKEKSALLSWRKNLVMI